MDIRIINTCNNNCTYCLEQSLRKKEEFLDKNIIFDILENEADKDVLTFYGGNSLLHPDFLEIISYAKNIGFKNIGLLTNSLGIDKDILLRLSKSGLNNFGVYFNTFDEIKHDLIVGKGGIKLSNLLENIKFINMNNNFILKIIIHINKQNINTVYKDILILNKKYFINNFEFINYFPFDRPYNKYKNILQYSIFKERFYINNIFKIIDKLNLKTHFSKFSKDFFGKNKRFYSYEFGILKQIGEEDIEIINGKKEPFCLIEKRCKYCFLKDKCNWYE